MLALTRDGERVYDQFRDRITFPIRDAGGVPVAFGGRILTEDDNIPKYINSPETELFRKRAILFGLDRAAPRIMKTRKVIVTEGYTDVVTLHQHRFDNSVGVLGTSFTYEHTLLLGALAQSVELLFDGDEAGRMAAIKSIGRMISVGMPCRVVLLPEGEDADSLLRKHGVDAFLDCFATAREGLDFAMEYVRARYSPLQKLDWAKDIIENASEELLRGRLLRQLTDGLDLHHGAFMETVAAPILERRAQLF